jgi:hypothetical protein
MAKQEPQSHGKAIAALVLGIMGVLLFWVPLIGLILGILALTFGIIGVNQKQGGMAIAGIVLGGLTLFLQIFVLIGVLAYFGTLSPENFVPERCTVNGGFSCTEFSIDRERDLIMLNLRNDLGTDASIVRVTLSTNDCSLTNAATMYDAPLVNGANTGLLTYQCDDIEGNFMGDIQVEYVRVGETVSHTALGTVSGVAE